MFVLLFKFIMCVCPRNAGSLKFIRDVVGRFQPIRVWYKILYQNLVDQTRLSFPRVYTSGFERRGPIYQCARVNRLFCKFSPPVDWKFGEFFVKKDDPSTLIAMDNGKSKSYDHKKISSFWLVILEACKSCSTHQFRNLIYWLLSNL